MKKGLRVAAVALVGVCLLSCEKTEQTFTINPDGSGKIRYVATFPLDVQATPTMGEGKQPQTDEEKVAAAQEKVLTASEGVEAWKDVKCVATEDGLIRFSGTAYFRDITALKLASLAGFRKSGDSKLRFETIPGGYRVLAKVIKDKKKDKEDAVVKREPPTTPAELRRELRRARTSWQYMRHMAGAALANEVQTHHFVAPKKAAKAENFTRTPTGYSFVFDGRKVFSALDKLMQKPDDELIAILAKGVDLKNNEEATKYIFDKLGMDPNRDMTLEVQLDGPLFDYEKEIAGARKEYAALCLKEGYSPRGLATTVTRSGSRGNDQHDHGPAGPAAAGTIKSAGVNSIQRFFKVGDRDHEQANFTVRVDFDGAVTTFVSADLSELTAEDGRALIEGPRKLNGRLVDDGTAASFTVEVPLKEGLTRIAKAAGTLEYAVSTEPREVDLGVLEIKEGETGDVLDAKIRSVRDGWLKLAFTADATKVKDVLVYRPDGTPYEANKFSGQEWQGKYQKTFRPARDDKRQWPEKLGFKVVLFTKTESYSAPWSVSSIQLPTTD